MTGRDQAVPGSRGAGSNANYSETLVKSLQRSPQLARPPSWIWQQAAVRDTLLETKLTTRKFFLLYLFMKRQTPAGKVFVSTYCCVLFIRQRYGRDPQPGSVRFVGEFDTNYKQRRLPDSFPLGIPLIKRCSRPQQSSRYSRVNAKRTNTSFKLLQLQQQETIG